MKETPEGVEVDLEAEAGGRGLGQALLDGLKGAGGEPIKEVVPLGFGERGKEAIFSHGMMDQQFRLGGSNTRARGENGEKMADPLKPANES